MARTVANLLNPGQELLVNEEEKDSKNFWELFPSGKKKYFSSWREPRKEIRLKKKKIKKFSETFLQSFRMQLRHRNFQSL